MSSEFNFGRVLKNFERLKQTVPTKVANATQNFFAQSWKKQGFTDNGLQSWAPRQKETKKTAGKAILVSSGNLRKAVQNSIRDKRFDKIRMAVDLPYAKRHNDGLEGMPKRQFMGDSKTLRKEQIALIKKEIDKIWA